MTEPILNLLAQTAQRFKNRPAETRLERFWGYVNKSADHDCWVWAAGRGSHGYGTFWTGKELLLAHRLSYILANGPIPDGLFVLHKCDNRPCINPSHLFLGTQGDNVKDRDAKNRVAYGSNHYLAKLTEEDVASIRDIYEPGKITHEQIAERFGVSRTTITLVLNCKHWDRVDRKGYKPHNTGNNSTTSSKGTEQHFAKLTDNKVREIRELYATGQYTFMRLGRLYGVWGNTIKCAVKRRTWKHVK